MRERFIHHLCVERPPDSESAAEARERLRHKFPRNAVRRMTHLGMLIGSTLEGVELAATDALVYATSFAETRALEDFLDSFPHPSPLLFQTSIHPGGVQQVLIGRQQPVARLWPLAGRARLVEQALLTALLEPASRVALVGGEERGTWLLEQGQASDRSFAFAFVLTPESAGAAGSVCFGSAGGSPERGNATSGRVLPADAARRRPEVAVRLADEPPALPDFADALAERRPLAWRGAGGDWRLAWR